MAKTSFDALSRVLRALQTYQVGLLETVCAWLGDDFKLDPQAGFELKTGTIRNIMTYIPTKFEIEFFRLGADEHDQERFARRRQLALPELQIEAVIPTAEDVVTFLAATR